MKSEGLDILVDAFVAAPELTTRQVLKAFSKGVAQAYADRGEPLYGQPVPHPIMVGVARELAKKKIAAAAAQGGAT